MDHLGRILGCSEIETCLELQTGHGHFVSSLWLSGLHSPLRFW